MSEDYFGYVYKITNLINGKIYVGMRKGNINNFEKYWGSGILIKRAILKYGIENFKKEVIEEATTRNNLASKEIFWIKELNSLAKNGYNISKGGFGANGVIPSEETRRKIGLASLGRKMPKGKDSKCYGLKHSYETRMKMGASRKGKKLSEAHKKSLSKALKGINIDGKSPTCKTWSLYSPCGVKYIVKGNFEKFCKENSISLGIRRAIKRGNPNYHGWSIFILDKGKFDSTGTKQSKETINKRVLKLKGRKISNDQKLIISRTQKGKIVSEETRRKISLKKMGKKTGKNNPAAKEWEFYSPCGVKHSVIGDIKKFCKELKYSPSTFYELLKNNINTYKGWRFYKIT